MIERNVRVQTQLIEDLLDVSRIVTGKLRVEVRPIELVPVVEAGLEAVRPSADAKEIHVVRGPRAAGRARARRPRPPAAGGVEPGQQRREVHAAGRARRGVAAPDRLPRAAPGARHRQGHPRGLPAPRLRALPPGGQHQHAQVRRPRAGPGHRPPPRGAARGHGARGERGHRPGRDVYGAPAPGGGGAHDPTSGAAAPDGGAAREPRRRARPARGRRDRQPRLPEHDAATIRRPGDGAGHGGGGGIGGAGGDGRTSW